MSIRRQKRAFFILGLCLLAGVLILKFLPPHPHRLPPSPDSPVIAVVCGQSHTLAILENGTVWSWGFNDDSPRSGMLGNDKVKTSSAVPVNVIGLHDINQVATGFSHCLALSKDGRVWGWGASFGQLGVNPMLFLLEPARYKSLWPPRLDYSIRTPVQVRGLKEIKAITCYVWYTLALQDDGTVLYLGGFRDVNGMPTSRSSPEPFPGLDGIAQISGHSYLCLALKSDGTVQAIGTDQYGEMGNGAVQKSGRTDTPVPVQGLDRVISVSAGDIHSMALRADGTVWTWGCNVNGQLGNGATSTGPNPVPKQVAGLSNITAISAGFDHNLALAKDGTVWAWGFNKSGQLGDGTTIDRTRPVKVPGLHDITAISAGGGHSAAIDGQGVLWTWGDNKGGQLGDGTYVTRLKPVKALIGAGSASTVKAR